MADDPQWSAALHGSPVLEVPLHDQLAIPIDVHVPRPVVSDPGQEDVVAAPDLRHEMLPHKGALDPWPPDRPLRTALAGSREVRQRTGVPPGGFHEGRCPVAPWTATSRALASPPLGLSERNRAVQRP